jgi:hypothetical protein
MDASARGGSVTCPAVREQFTRSGNMIDPCLPIRSQLLWDAYQKGRPSQIRYGTRGAGGTAPVELGEGRWSKHNN